LQAALAAIGGEESCAPVPDLWGSILRLASHSSYGTEDDVQVEQIGESSVLVLCRRIPQQINKIAGFRLPRGATCQSSRVLKRAAPLTSLPMIRLAIWLPNFLNLPGH